ncbi:MAG: hypothetical protein R3A50_08765 [Saprospiraceae bacterium]|nr:hypothetical protein [Lewinellaceae bacterium]
MKTQVVILRQQSLTLAQIEEMWALYSGFYNYTEQYFRERIHRNTHFSLYLQQGRIIGFTGLRIDKVKLSGQDQLLFYFGQTVIARAFRGKSLIQTTALMLLFKYWKECLHCQVWFWYDALSYKAYLAAANCAHEIYPSHRCPMPEKVRQIRDFAGITWYGEAYCPASGTVKKAINYVNDAATNIFPEDLTNPDVAFFVHNNPGYSHGQGLLTFIPVTSQNLLVLVKRYWNRMFNHKTKKRQSKSANVQPAFGH